MSLSRDVQRNERASGTMRKKKGTAGMGRNASRNRRRKSRPRALSLLPLHVPRLYGIE